MGDRGNIVVSYRSEPNPEEASPAGIIIYTHWGGHRIKQTVAHTWKRSNRKHDAPYFARALFIDTILDGVYDTIDGTLYRGRDLIMATTDDGTLINHHSTLLSWLLEETGIGLSPYLLDNEYPIVIIEPETSRVAVFKFDWQKRWEEDYPSDAMGFILRADEDNLWVPIDPWVEKILAAKIEHGEDPKDTDPKDTDPKDTDPKDEG